MAYKILIIDDHTEFLKMLRIYFTIKKYEIITAENGFSSGGDDYILKPFRLKELDARITAHLKREVRRKNRADCFFRANCRLTIWRRRGRFTQIIKRAVRKM